MGLKLDGIGPRFGHSINEGVRESETSIMR